MWEILTALRTLILSESTADGDLPQIHQVKRGMLAPKAPFPQIAVIPVSETYAKISSGGRATLHKNVDVILYWRDLGGKQAIRNMETHVDALSSLIESKRQLSDETDTLTMNANMGSVSYAEEELNQGVFHTARVPVLYITKEDLPSPTITKTSINDPGIRSTVSLIYDNLRNDSALSDVKGFHDSGFGPIQNFPAIVIEGERETASPVFSGADQG